MSAEAFAAWAGVAFAAASLVVAILATLRANRAIAVTERDEARRLERSHVEWSQDLRDGEGYVLRNTGTDPALDVQVRARIKTQSGVVQLLGTCERLAPDSELTLALTFPVERQTLVVTEDDHLGFPVRNWKCEARISWRTQLGQLRDADLPSESLPKIGCKSLRPIMGG